MFAVVQPLLIRSQGAPPDALRLDSIFDYLVAGGPVMVPLALCSVVALGFAFERLLALRARALGLANFERELSAAIASGGAPSGIELCAQRATPVARVLRVALLRCNAPFAEREKQVEDVAHRELRELSANLKPLVYIATLAPLLGFLGTVYGMIVAFETVALRQGLGRPEFLADGISQALITTAAGLTIAVPTLVTFYWMKARIERFARRLEELHGRVMEQLTSGTPPPQVAPPPAAAQAQPPAQSQAVLQTA